jgi:Skp family chaperone for outer membrane proteins
MGMIWTKIMRESAVLVTLGICGSAAMAQSKPAAEPRPTAKASAEQGTKVGAINMRLAIASTAEGKQASAQLESEFMRGEKNWKI